MTLLIFQRETLEDGWTVEPSIIQINTLLLAVTGCCLKERSCLLVSLSNLGIVRPTRSTALPARLQSEASTIIIHISGLTPRQCPRTSKEFHGYVHGVPRTTVDIPRATADLLTGSHGHSAEYLGKWRNIHGSFHGNLHGSIHGEAAVRCLTSLCVFKTMELTLTPTLTVTHTKYWSKCPLISVGNEVK